ncbi:archaeosortase/exosortase family protein [Candidatus Woesearchaeota archaeon]|jgi:exosortase/archaeosortase family protein|nr:archaeosortase/exosortase family protein [Candidatus Woesearchaeota archaeon]MBT6519406.1 archaeosortase/exosortase family protein [Candidatus Woesearchaeota archaeon]MBT7368078.1 archaeosortase/exosortase family protein [Candidatus Woesearchaeota archaeon]
MTINSKNNNQLTRFRLKYIAYFTSLFVLIPVLLELFAKLFDLKIGFTIILERLHILFFVLFVLFFIINEEKLVKIKNTPSKYQIILFSIISIILLSQFFFLRYGLHPKNNYNIAQLIFQVSSLFYILAAIALFCAFFGWNFTKKITKTYKKTFIAMLILVFIYKSVKGFLDFNWKFFAGVVAKISAFLLNIVYPGQVASTIVTSADFKLIAKDFIAGISKDCSGVESSSLFVFLFLVVLLYDPSIKKDLKTFLFFGVALIGDFILTSFRIFALTIVALEIDRTFAINLFHNNIGWVLFVIYFLLFYYILIKYFRKKKTKKTNEKIKIKKTKKEKNQINTTTKGKKKLNDKNMQIIKLKQILHTAFSNIIKKTNKNKKIKNNTKK